MPNPSKQIIINAIIKEIEQGKTRGEVLAKIVKKWQISVRTGDRYWKTANEQQKERQNKASKASDKAYIETKVEAVKTGLKSKLEKQLELQNEIDTIGKQLRGEIQFNFMFGSKIMKSHNNDVFMLPVEKQDKLRETRLKYIAELNKMAGDHSPAKIDHTTKGEKIQSVTIFKIPDNERD